MCAIAFCFFTSQSFFSLSTWTKSECQLLKHDLKQVKNLTDHIYGSYTMCLQSLRSLEETQSLFILCPIISKGKWQKYQLSKKCIFTNLWRKVSRKMLGIFHWQHNSASLPRFSYFMELLKIIPGSYPSFSNHSFIQQRSLVKHPVMGCVIGIGIPEVRK